MRKNYFITLTLAMSISLACSVTSFASWGGWTFQSGNWRYYEDSKPVCNEWRPSGRDTFWLNSDGNMASNELVKDGDDYYYAGEIGPIVKDTWILCDFHNDKEWFYFGSDGKAVKGWQTIGDKKYHFDTKDCTMDYGWFVDTDGKGYNLGTKSTGWLEEN